MGAAQVPRRGAGAVAGSATDLSWPSPAPQHPNGRALDFSSVRGELGLPADYPAAALAEIEQTVASPVIRTPRLDATDLPLVTVDPPGSKDLDQAVLVRRRLGGRGYRVYYAIADVAAFVPPGGAIDAEVLNRGQTLYLPDGNVPLHPTLLSEGAASLLPEQVRPAVLWTIDLDGYGEATRTRVRRALVRSVAQLDYTGVQRSLELGVAHPSIELLPEVGRLRRERALARGAIELGLPQQQVRSDGNGGWQVVLRPRLLVEEWNAEISLLTGMCAAEIMVESGTGLLRTLPDPERGTVDWLRRSAARLGVSWPDHHGPAEFLAGLDPQRPEALALHVAATRLLRGTGYTAFSAGVPAKTGHAGIGADYAHVTAPLRRLADRYAAEVCLAVAHDREIPEWVVEALPLLPSAMGNSDRVAAKVERACIAQAEAWTLAGQVGTEFPATVLKANGLKANGLKANGLKANGLKTDGLKADGEDPAAGEIFVADPPVIARCTGDELVEGQPVRVRLAEADPQLRRVTFEVI